MKILNEDHSPWRAEFKWFTWRFLRSNLLFYSDLKPVEKGYRWSYKHHIRKNIILFVMYVKYYVQTIIRMVSIMSTHSEKVNMRDLTFIQYLNLWFFIINRMELYFKCNYFPKWSAWLKGIRCHEYYSETNQIHHCLEIY